MQTYSLTLSKRELSYTILAVQKYRQSLLDSDDDEIGEELGDLMVLDSALAKLRAVRDEDD